MRSDLWRRAEDLLHAALELPPETRDDFLRGSCAGDDELQTEVRSLLSSEQQAGSFLERPAAHLLAGGDSLAGQTVSHYRIVDRIGGGGMGVVYRAEDTRLRRFVAVKFLSEAFLRDPEALSRFRREAYTASRIDHPHICTVHDVDEDDHGRPFLVMELLQGETLRERLQRGAVAVPDILDWANDVAGALHAAHDAGIVHRDIKPANLFLTTSGGAKILDFGLARLVRPRQSAVTTQALDDGEFQTSPGEALGTVAYMSPEQARGEELDPRTDLFSLGVVLYEMATGRAPFSGATTALVFDSILNRTPAPPRECNPRLPPELDRIIRKALEKDRQVRYQSAGELLADIERLRREITSGVASQPRRKPVWIAVVTIVLLAIAAAAIVSVWRGTRPERSASELTPVRLTANGADDSVETAAISPDGKMLAYSDRDGVHVKATKSTESRLLPNTRQMSVRYWSADGAQIFLNNVDENYSISPVGENPHPLGRSVPFPDGRHIFAYSEDAIELRRLDGRVIASVLRTGNHGELQAPMAPGDGYVAAAFFASSGSYGSFWIDAWNLETGRRTNVVPPQTRIITGLTWLPGGRLVYALSQRESAGSMPPEDLWDVNVNLGSGLPIGAPVRRTNWTDFLMEDLSASADGSTLCFRRTRRHIDIWIGTLKAKGSVLANARRLTDAESFEWPAAWTPDSRALVFSSDRSGLFQLYRQEIDKQTAEALTFGSEIMGGRISPDGKWLVYGLSQTGVSRIRLVRVPLTGGEPREILVSDSLVDYSCSQRPAGPCVMLEAGPEGLTASVLDPLKGRGARLFSIPSLGAAAISPDGTRLALIQGRKIRIVSLHGVPEAEITVSGADRLQDISWTADGSAFFAAEAHGGSETRLLHVDRSGASQIIWTVPGLVDLGGIASPDGRYLATYRKIIAGNAWMVQNL
ncbi:MAG TPA: protein kinase [Bryobacteraceae bacterium]|nr:protein kinase [Bryobacteraceae bacterium]